MKRIKYFLILVCAFVLTTGMTVQAKDSDYEIPTQGIMFAKYQNQIWLAPAERVKYTDCVALVMEGDPVEVIALHKYPGYTEQWKVRYKGGTYYINEDTLTAAGSNQPPTVTKGGIDTTGRTTRISVEGDVEVLYGYSAKGIPLYTAEEAWPEWLVNELDMAGVTPEMSDYEKAVAINNYICGRIEYDHEEYNKWRRGEPNKMDLSNSVYNVLERGLAVCEGYANLFESLALMAGLDSYYCSGNVSYSTYGHAWNRVVIDGVSYYVDTTWNDERGKAPSNKYLMLSYDEFYKNGKHIANDSRYQEHSRQKGWYIDISNGISFVIG